jgi:hypothetical protein
VLEVDNKALKAIESNKKEGHNSLEEEDNESRK